MPGLPQSGLLSQRRLITLLNSHGYTETTTPMLFRHSSRPITFTLVVDDFGVKYSSPSDLDHLITCLQTLYALKTHRTGNHYNYLGYTIDYAKPDRTMTLSMPAYIPSLLRQLRPSGIRPAPSPAIYTPPSYGSTAPQITPVDLSPLASPAQHKEIQVVCGSLLYYARALDPTFLPATTALASSQARPTLNAVAASNRLLSYAAAHPNHSITIRRSNMTLTAACDASFLSRPKSGSVAGATFHLGPVPSTDPASPPTTPSVALHKFSTRIPVVCASIAEAEYAALFAAMQTACELRATLTNFGYPQPPTPMYVDNKCAQGLATKTVRPKRSKSIDMRFDWIVDRVSQNLFTVNFIPGTTNIADFYTKPLPVHEHKQLIPLLLGQ